MERREEGGEGRKKEGGEVGGKDEGSEGGREGRPTSKPTERGRDEKNTH